jgi:hypothetical protein
MSGLSLSLFRLSYNSIAKFSDGSHVVAKFTPKLRAYITSDYQESQILDVAILSDVIWEEDLDGLSQSTTWSLERDPASGRYIITQD